MPPTVVFEYFMNYKILKYFTDNLHILPEIFETSEIFKNNFFFNYNAAG